MGMGQASGGGGGGGDPLFPNRLPNRGQPVLQAFVALPCGPS